MNRHAILFGSETLLGHALGSRLLDEGATVSVVRRWDREPGELVAAGATDLVVDLGNERSLVDALVGKNWVFWTHTPGLPAGADAQMRHSVGLFRRLTSAVRQAGADRIVATLPASICWEPGEGVIDESNRYVPGTASDARLDAHYAAYQAHCYSAADGVDVVTIASTLLVGNDVRPLRIAVPRDGRKVDVCHVDEAARAHVRAASHAQWGELFLLGGHAVTRRELATLVPCPRRPGILGRGGDDPRRHLVDPGLRIDPSKAVNALGFEPSRGF